MLRDLVAELATVIREDVGATLEADGIGVQVEPGIVTAPSSAITIDVFLGSTEPPRTSDAAGFGDISGFYVLTVRARLNIADSTATQDILMDMNDDQHELCIPAIVESDQTLNGWATQVVVDADGFSGLREYPGTVPPMVGCAWRVLVGQAVS